MAESETISDPAFEIDLECKNCGAEWTEQCRKKTEIFDSSLSRTKIIDRTHDHHLGTMDCEYCRIIDCPVCELDEHITVKDRRPIDE